MLEATFFFFGTISTVSETMMLIITVYLCVTVYVCVCEKEKERNRDCVFSNVTDYLKIHISFRPEVAKLQPTS